MKDRKDYLMELLRDGKYIVYTSLNHVSRSGMSRSISLFVAVCRGELQNITSLAATEMGEKRDRYDGITVGGCGMDMGFSLVYNLSSTLFPKGFRCHGKACRSNDHSNGDRNYDGRHRHTSGGYALSHRWI